MHKCTNAKMDKCTCRNAHAQMPMHKCPCTNAHAQMPMHKCPCKNACTDADAKMHVQMHMQKFFILFIISNNTYINGIKTNIQQKPKM